MAKKMTGYPSKDKLHLRGTKFFERHPIIPPVTFSQVIDAMFFMQGNHYIVDCLDLRVDVAQFQADSNMMAKAFLKLGVKPKDIIAVSMPNYYQAIPVFKAANMIGATVTYLNPFAETEETIHYLNLYRSPVFITCNTNKDCFAAVQNSTAIKYILSMDESNANSRDFLKEPFMGIEPIMDLHCIGHVAQMWKKRVWGIFGGKQDALILYTSGSTGKAKSLLFTNENLIASCIYLKNSTHVPDVTPDDSRWMNVVPFMYPYGFGASVLQTFLSGREVILTPHLSPENIAYYYGKKPHLVFGSPAHLELTKRNLPDDMQIPELKTYLSGGDYLSVSQSHDAIEFFSRHGAITAISNSSGTGETLGCSTNAMNIPYRPETVGQLVVGPKYLIIDPATKEEVKYGEKGVLCTSGKHVFKGYYGNEKLTEETKITLDGEEYYMTGNIGSLDEDRYFTLLGRASRFFIINTLNKVYCELIQIVLSGIDAVDNCAVVPKSDEESLYQAKAYIVLKQGFLPTSETCDYIISKCKETYTDKTTGEQITLKSYEIPASITFLDALPRTISAEKVDYEYLRKLAEEEYRIGKSL